MQENKNDSNEKDETCQLKKIAQVFEESSRNWTMEAFNPVAWYTVYICANVYVYTILIPANCSSSD